MRLWLHIEKYKIKLDKDVTKVNDQIFYFSLVFLCVYEETTGLFFLIY